MHPSVPENDDYSLDASHRQIANASTIRPKRNDEVEEFARHMHNVAKKLEEEED